MVTATMRRNGYTPDALIETLRTVQSAFGYIDDTALRFVAHDLHIPLSKAYGVATDPCLSCSTHALGEMPLHVQVFDAVGDLVDERIR